MKPLKIGDRVVAYGHGWSGVRPQSSTTGRVTGAVREIKDDIVLINIDRKHFATVDEGVEWISYHRIQCRKLKPKRKAREWDLVQSDGLIHTCNGPRLERNESVRVREVLPKKVSR